MVERLLWSGRQWCSNAPGQPAKASFSRGQDEKGAVAGTVAPTIGDEAWRDRFGSVRRAGPAAEERQGDDQGRQADRKTDGRGGRVGEARGSYGAGTSPAGALVHLPCCHTKGDTIRVGPKDGERAMFFFSSLFFPFHPIVGWCAVAPDGPKWAARGEVWRMGGWEVGKGEGGMRCHCLTPDGPKWTARSSESPWGGGR